MIARVTCLVGLALAAACAVPVDPSETSETTGTASTALAAPPLTRAEIIALAETGMGYSYWWGGGRWDPTNKSYPGKCTGSCPSCSHSALPAGGPEYGADCSGFVSQVWQVPNRQPPTGPRPPYNTDTYRNSELYWHRIERSELQRGDALVYRSGSSGHIVLFDRVGSGGNTVVYECAGCSTGCVHRSRSIGDAYIAIRRNGLEDVAPNHDSEGELQIANCSEISGWAYDSDSPDQPVEVVLTFGGPIRQQNAVRVTVQANEHRQELCDELGSCEHGFSAEIPDSLKDGRRRSVYAYAVDPQTGAHELLVGAPRSFTCGMPQTNTGICGHGMCQEGHALAPSCSPCANAVCAERPECCDAQGSWDATCVEIAGDTRGACAGVCYNGITSCSHSECTDGAALSPSCSTCAASVCELDPYCCEKKWDWICAGEAKRDPYCLCK